VDFLQLLIPRFIKRAVDALEQEMATSALLLQYAGLIVTVAIGVAVCRFLWRYLVIGFSRLLERDLRDTMMSHLLKLDARFFQRHTTGEIMALGSNDLAAVQLACGIGLISCVDAFVMTIAALAFMAYINPQLTLIAVAPMPVLAIATRLLSSKLHKRFQKVQEQFSKLTEYARSTLSSIHLIKAYTQEESQTGHFGKLGDAYIRDNLRVATIQGILFPFSGFIANASLLLVLFYGGRLTIQAEITVGDFIAFISYLFMLTWPMMAIGWVINLFQRGATSLGRIQKILQAKPELQDVPATEPHLPRPQSITINHLSFAYPGSEQAVISGLDVTFSKGLAGIVGKTGSGKSTLCNVLARIYPVDKGTFLLDGRDVNTLPLAAVRSCIAYVPQETTLFSETIQFNIALGKESASMSEIHEVARVAAIHDEIMALEHGYQTRIGERGVKLSGGQRQRIALARALILDHPVLIIDDGLSAVDMKTEHAIIEAIASYLKERICIVVSHRVAPLIAAREILVMDKGCIVARGTHQELLKTSDFYATIFSHQAAALEEEV
jgi:ATP-binding cassette subfamily B protein